MRTEPGMKRKGTYVLSITLGADSEIRIGALGTFTFEKGQYLYAGSAMGGLDQRISRHIRRDKTVRWHVDNLTTVADSVEAFESYPDPVPECTLASVASDCGMVPSVNGFGCSDCSCRTHLFRIVPGSLERLLDITGMVPFEDHRNEIK